MAAGSVSAESPMKKSVRYQLLPAIVLAIIWLTVLAVLSLWTANPVTVNRTQILNSQFILTARIIDPQKGTVEILELKQTRNEPFDQSLINKKINLQPTRINWEKSSTRIFPVYRDKAGDWFITPAPLPKFNYIDYPATNSIRSEIAQILAHHS